MSKNQFSKGQIILSYITILRVINGIVAGAAAAFGLVLSLPIDVTDIDFLTIGLVVLAAMFVSCQAMIFNDIADREEDKINAPQRPIPSGKISIKAAYVYGIIFACFALITAIVIDIINNLYGLSVLTAIIFGGSLDLYDFKLKQLGFWGNVTIGLNVTALFAYGALHSYLVYGGTFQYVPIIVGAAAGLGNIGREVIKGLPDVEGDRESGVKTLAVELGTKPAAVIGSIFLFCLLTGGGIAVFIGLFYPIGLNYLVSIIIGALLIALVLFLAVAILINQSPKWAYTTKEILLIVYLVFLLIFIVDKIVALLIG
ncbi:MAG: UbiA family prenyltransferase [Candidatus Heimdallarchaeota archaeon]|nr:UbiA family prenyltransferase [Candidatus Heimdallarchaeota archaeon]